MTAERDTLKGTVETLTAERDSAVKERDALQAEVDRLSKLVGEAAVPPEAAASTGKQTAEEWLREQFEKKE